MIHPRDAKPASHCTAQCPTLQPLVMFIGGAKDDVYMNVLKYIFEPYNAAHESHQDIGYGTWQTGSEIASIAREWHAKGQKICLVGHSYGGCTAMGVACNLAGIDVELMVTLDPVRETETCADIEIKGKMKWNKPGNVKRWVNVYVDYSKVKIGGLTTPNRIAWVGGPLESCPSADMNVSLHSLTNTDYDGSDHAYAHHMFQLSGSNMEVANVT